MKKASVFLLGLVILFCFQVGSAFAETPLDSTVDKLIGTPYKWAGTTTKGFDCSGFTMYVFKQFGIDLVHSSKGQDDAGYWISEKDLRPGDLVFFSTDGVGVSHVGIYLGDGEFIHSSSSDGVIKSKLDEKYYARRYVAARRVLTDDKFKELTTDADKSVADAADAKSGSAAGSADAQATVAKSADVQTAATGNTAAN